ncbi:hypothetical protein [Rhodococcus erythropolis]|uniref:hypothetical protein n=1 Tax=Rhodococcus erythropolis TaxID=1833 RepID=UPI00038E6E01|nr:hypothetical protein [Rhodococcus erythropolis]EQM31524.1 hypothetical protein N601_22130 [Rhodococcus erythropolis DN1]
MQRDLTLQARIIENLVGIFPANVDSATITSKLKTNTKVVNRALAAKSAKRPVPRSTLSSCTRSRVSLRVQAQDVTIWRKIGVLFLALVWTLVAAALVLFGLWDSIDTSCDGPAERDMAGGGWLVIATLSVWSGAFVVCALRLRTVTAAVLATLSVVSSTLVVVNMLATASGLCW